ncbi:MAG: phosphoribosylformylglycinamidine synthase [Deltaproteobacteria bacterium]|nr:phosphoribosylformylglycinamidine synthase [Deltaproteobacteria bacterium]
MLTIQGGALFSPARRIQRLDQLKVRHPTIRAIDARYLHFVQIAGPLDRRGREVLEALVTYGPTHGPSHGPSDAPNGERDDERIEADGCTQRFWVVPRIGTISPWSSKATDVAQICGLKSVTRIERGIEWRVTHAVRPADEHATFDGFYDPMTESVLEGLDQAERLFLHQEPRSFQTIALGARGRDALEEANANLCLALSLDELDYLLDAFGRMGRDPTDVELMMFAQANSEHCRHKIFNAEFIIDGVPQESTLFQMIRRSTEASPRGVISAYSDNAAVVDGVVAGRFFPDAETGVYDFHVEPVCMLMKVETHNHPTAISPAPGASTGSGGEIRDEGATGRGAKPKAGLVGFSVSNLFIPGAVQPWETTIGRPTRIASPLQIMLEAPIGSASYNNEFGRPAILGYFRTFEMTSSSPASSSPASSSTEARGYHKPIMLAGGIGNIRTSHIHKSPIPAGACFVVLGGPAMLIGLGGGAASSVDAGASSEDLDFASVQRDNAELERRCQEVIDRCWALGDMNPIISIHDVGAGGLSNALPELAHGGGRGARLALRAILNAEPGLTPLEIWCNEAQERYVLAIARDRLDQFVTLCERERCPCAVVGEATDAPVLRLEDEHFSSTPIDVSLDLLFGKPPRATRRDERVYGRAAAARARPDGDVSVARVGEDVNVASEVDHGSDGEAALHSIDLEEAAFRVLRLPTVADKTFLVTIGDRTVGGLVCRDPMVGPWQVPVADAAVTATGFDAYTGEAMAIGERAPLALLDPAASARMAVGEAITNIASAAIADLGDLKLSANWMAAAGQRGEEAGLYDAVKAVGAELCPKLGIAIPVGKDSLSMKTVWCDERDGVERAVVAPMTLVVTAFAPVVDVRRSLTPAVDVDHDVAVLLLIDLGAGANRLGGSALAQVYGQLGSKAPDLDDAHRVKGFFEAVQALNTQGLLLAYHDRSDGGLFATLVEMAFASDAGLAVDIGPLAAYARSRSDRDGPDLAGTEQAVLFAEELGAVVAVLPDDVDRCLSIFAAHRLQDVTHRLGLLKRSTERVSFSCSGRRVFDVSRFALRAAWSETTYAMQRLRDDRRCADEEHAARVEASNPASCLRVTFDLEDDIALPFVLSGARPRIAVLRDQGVNGHTEMAAAFHRAGFQAEDVHMTDLFEGRRKLSDYRGFVACGGFSYGDVLGAGGGWAKSVLFHERMRAMFEGFFQRTDTFALGVCNGCQMLASLKALIPGANHWPRFVRNRSEQFEARLSMVRIEKSPSILFRGMEGSVVPIAVAHGEGRTEFSDLDAELGLRTAGLVAVRFVDVRGEPTERYPQNPNGSVGGIAALTNLDGRVTIMMPHPERVFRTVQHSWHPSQWQEDAPWMRMFRNARRWVG